MGKPIIMETTFKEEIEKANCLLDNVSKVNMLLDIKKEIEADKICIDCSEEYKFLETRACNEETERCLKIINNKIKELLAKKD